MASSPYVAGRHLPGLRLAAAVVLSLPATAFALWEHDEESLLRLGACLVWLVFGYYWGWRDRATTMQTSPAQNEGAERA